MGKNRIEIAASKRTDFPKTIELQYFNVKKENCGQLSFSMKLCGVIFHVCPTTHIQPVCMSRSLALHNAENKVNIAENKLSINFNLFVGYFYKHVRRTNIRKVITTSVSHHIALIYNVRSVCLSFVTVHSLSLSFSVVRRIQFYFVRLRCIYT